jgi:hypothetical protein
MKFHHYVIYTVWLLAIALLLPSTRVLAEVSGPLDIRYAKGFKRVWWDKGSGGKYDGAYYRPLAPSGYHILGHYGQGNYYYPYGRVIVVKAIARLPGSRTALKRPKDYWNIWGDQGSWAKENGAFWQPIPHRGYKCLGVVATRGYRKPSRNEIRCVRNDLLAAARVGKRIWIDKGTGAYRDFGSWRIVPLNSEGINSGLFVAHASHRRPSNRGLYTLRKPKY